MRIFGMILIALYVLLGGESEAADDERRVAAIYHACHRYPDEGLHDPRAIDGDPLAVHPSDVRQANYLDPAWHRKQLQAMGAAGVDIALLRLSGPLCVPGDARASEHPGLPHVIVACEKLRREGEPCPKIGLLLDAGSLVDRGEVSSRAREFVNLATPFGRQLFYDTIAGFYRRVPKAHRADVRGKPIVVLDPVDGIGAYRVDLLDFATTRFRLDFDGREPAWIVERSWGLEGETTYVAGGALAGPAGGEVVVIGPGYDDSRSPDGRLPVRHREGGRFYEASWSEAFRPETWMVLLDSWDGFLEGTALGETREHGRSYIERTQKWASRFRAGRPPLKVPEVRDRHPRPRPDWFWGREAKGAESVRFVGDPASSEPAGLAVLRQEDGVPQFLELGGESCVMSVGAEPRMVRYLYFAVSDHFLFDEPAAVEITLRFHDGTPGELELQYDSAEEGPGRRGAYKKAAAFLRSGTDRWVTQTVRIADARFANRQNGGADFRLAVRGTDAVISKLVVRRAIADAGPVR